MTMEPCPFCGGKHIESVSKTKTGKDIHACMTCGAEAPNWNRRAAPSAGLREALELLQGFLSCPEIADCAPEDKDPETDDLERRARALTLSKEGARDRG